jgi:hypothetical protein
MKLIGTYSLKVCALSDEDETTIKAFPRLSGYLIEASENLSNLLPDGYYVSIGEDREKRYRDALREAFAILGPRTEQPCSCEGCDCENGLAAEVIARALSEQPGKETP